MRYPHEVLVPYPTNSRGTTSSAEATVSADRPESICIYPYRQYTSMVRNIRVFRDGYPISLANGVHYRTDSKSMLLYYYMYECTICLDDLLLKN